LPAVVIIGVAEAQVPIPDGFELDLAAAVLLQKGAVAEAVDVFRQLDEPMLIDEGIEVQVSGVAIGRIHEIRAIQGVLELIHVIRQPGALFRRQFVVLRIDIEELDAPPSVKAAAHVVAMIAFEQVSAGDGGLGRVGWVERGDIHAVFASLDLFHQYIDPLIVALAQPAIGPANEYLHEPGARGVMAHLIE